jgi:hypothetical protein
MKFGWRGDSKSGFGVKDFGRMVSESRRFSECMVAKVFEAVCRKPMSIDDHKTYIQFQASRFEGNHYSLKQLVANVAVTRECAQ